MTLRSQLIVVGLLLLTATGCPRRFYRLQADRDAHKLIAQKAQDPRWDMPNFTIDVDPESRLFDPFNPDRPPMPPDDPVAHQYMHRVDGKRGWPYWHRNGDVPVVDLEKWREYLPCDEEGRVVLDMEGAVLAGLMHSRTFQKEKEDLYLTALDVSFERFRFDAQFFGGNTTTFTADARERTGGGGETSSLLNNDANLEMHRLYAAGGELVVGVANSIVWQFAGPDGGTTNTLLNFNFVQPLLRFGGRARVLERLTISERGLLAAIRQMEQYRQGYYNFITTGRDPGEGPQRRGGVFGGAGLNGFTGVGGGGFGRIATVVTTTPATAGAGDAGGYIGLLQDQQQIRNQEANVAALDDSLAQLEAMFEAGRIDRFQIQLARQAQYNAQSRLLTAKTAYQTNLDLFKFNLGLPPALQVEVKDPLLKPLDLIDPTTTELQLDVGRVLTRARAAGAENRVVTAEDIERLLDRAEAVRARTDGRLEALDADFEKLIAALPSRRESLKKLSERTDLDDVDVDPRAYRVEDLEERVVQLRKDIAGLKKLLGLTWGRLDKLQAEAAGLKPEDARQQLIQIATDLSGHLLELSLSQARARLDATVLVPIDLQSDQALEIARYNRRDWMNARASLVDTWRLIQFNANALLSGLNVSFSGDINTTDNRPLNFNDATGRLRAGVQFDAPLTRLAERNVYRQSLIEYQQARRGYMQFEDRVSQTVRFVLRTVDLDQLNFELRRASVQVAITQVDLTRLRLNQPPKPEEAVGGKPAQFGVTTARDLVSALNDMLTAQNDFLSVWVNYEVLRRVLDFELGTMQLTDRGLWIDPGPITEGHMVDPGEPVPVPPGWEKLPPPMPDLELSVANPDADSQVDSMP